MARVVKTRIELWDAGMFPVMTGKDYGREEGACVPLALVLPHERQADRNHGQTLHRLAERGGLSACELAAVLEDREWRAMPEHEGWAAIFRAAVKAMPTEVERTSLEAAMEWHKAIVALASGWDEDGAIGPVAPLEWETIARMAMDYSRAALKEGPATTAIAPKCGTCNAILQTSGRCPNQWHHDSRSSIPSPLERRQDCQSGVADVCRAAKSDGIVCPAESCDIDDGLRREGLPQK